jgi:hypothetical protein
MKREYVDEFFAEGSLRLSSSFSVFRRNPDEQQGDALEGTLTMEATTPSGRFSFLGVLGEEHYVFCGTTSASRQLMEAFQCDDGFRVNDIESFARTIASCIPGFKHRMHHACEYSDEILTPNTTEPFPVDFNNIVDRELAFQQLRRYTARLHGNVSFFRK